MATLTGDNGILSEAEKAKIATELAGYKEEMELYQLQKYSENDEFIDESLTAGKTNLSYNTKPQEETGNIKTVITKISDEYFEKLEIIKGELLINTKDKKEVEVAQSLGIKVNPYDIVDGVLLSSKGNLLLMDEEGTVTIPDSVTEIGEGAFANLDGLKTIIIPGSVKVINANAFAYNSTLENVIMLDGVEKIGTNAFQFCTNLKNVEMPESLTQIALGAFYNCTSLTEINIPSKITIIEDYTFGVCTSLEKVQLPKKLEKIKYAAFMYTAFEEIEIPATVTEIGISAFSQNKKLKNIILEGNKNYVYESGMLMNSEKSEIVFISSSYISQL